MTEKESRIASDQELLNVARGTGVAFMEAYRELTNRNRHLEDPELLRIVDGIHNTVTGASPISELRKLQRALHGGVAQKMYPVGTIVTDSWTDETRRLRYSAPWRIVDYRRVVVPALGEERMVAILLRVHTTFLQVPYAPYYHQFFDRSDMDCWLNSRMRANDPHDKRASKFLRTHDGYAVGCSQELLRVAVPIEVMTRTGDKRPGREWEKTTSMFFAPSTEELNLTTEDGDPERPWGYFADTPTDSCHPCEKRMFHNLANFSTVYWTRDISSEYPEQAYCVNHFGQVFRRSVTDLANSLVACAIV